MAEGTELVVDDVMAAELDCNLDDITIGDADNMHRATGMVFECNDGHLKRILD